MKKTAMILLSLAAMAQAAETSLEFNDLFATTEGWTMSKGRAGDKPDFIINTTEQTMSLANSNWSQSIAVYDFSERPVCATSDIPLSFSVTMNTGDAKAYTMALIGTDKTIVVGTHYDWTPLQYGVTSTADGIKAYGFGSWTSSVYKMLDAGSEVHAFSTDKAVNTPITISGLSSYDAISGTYSLTLSIGEDSHTITGLENLNVVQLSFSGDGTNNQSNNVTFSALSLTGATPEPATATLSLLALAGLAARRRRH